MEITKENIITWNKEIAKMLGWDESKTDLPFNTDWNHLIMAKEIIVAITGKRITEMSIPRDGKVHYQVNVGELKSHDWVWSVHSSVIDMKPIELLFAVLGQLSEEYNISKEK